MQIWKNGSAIIGLAACHANWKLEQVRRGDQVVHPMRSGSFVGRGPWLHAISPAKPRSFTSLQMVHTQMPRSSGAFEGFDKWDEGEDERKMEMRWRRWKWDDSYLSGTRDGETPTPTHLAQRGQTLKGQGKRKSGRTTGQTQTRGGGADGSAWHNLQGERAKPTSAREGPKPDLEREHAWERGPMGN